MCRVCKVDWGWRSATLILFTLSVVYFLISLQANYHTMYDDYFGSRSSRNHPVQGSYDTAQICLNGHVTNSNAVKYPTHNKTFCDECGAKTITSCPDCKSNIKGDYELPGVVDFGEYHKPAFCDSCGKPYPWTQSAQEAAYELIEFSETLNEKEKGDFKNSVTELMVQSPKTSVAQVKFTSYAKKAGIEIAKGLKDILVDVVSETVKKAIWKE